MSELSVAVCSITATARRRWFWAAWWTRSPAHDPFVKPDASSGGAVSRESALRAARTAAGRELSEIEPRWARAWSRVLRELPPWTSRDLDEQQGIVRPRKPHAEQSLWAVLGVSREATPAELKRAYHARALETHPDHGGDPEAFRALRRAYERATSGRTGSARRGARGR